MSAYVKSVAALVGLLLCALPTLVLTLGAEFLLLLRGPRRRVPSGRTVLLTGGKMTKCLQLARMFHARGDRVIVAETPAYQFCGTRFSRAVDEYYIIPPITGDGVAYRHALVGIARRENVDLFVPVASPRSAVVDAVAKPAFPDRTEVFHCDEHIVRQLDDKHQFARLCRHFGLTAPESHLITSRAIMLTHRFTPGKKYILKKIAYDPVYRLDLRTLPHPGWEDRVRALPISQEEPWVLQEFIAGREVCTHTTAVAGRVALYVCSDSSPFQVNYAMLDLPAVSRWVRSFVRQLGVTGQLSFDFIVRDDGEVVPIECNPRTHSAITLLHNQPAAVAAYDSGRKHGKTYVPNASSGHTYWFYHELYRLLTCRSAGGRKRLLQRLATGKEAVFSREDPWPFWCNNHLSIPAQLLRQLGRGGDWTRIDFNIGKLVVPGGD